MKLLKVQEMVPPVYIEESRDFQLFCRLYTAVVNSIKFDIDSMKYITDTANCRTNVLQLLQTKLGFFTNKKFDDEVLRYVLRCFPDLLKNKGSRLGVEQAINVFLKIRHINSPIVVTTVSEGATIHGIEVDDHSIIVELNSMLKNTSILNELFRYIFPAGFSFYLYFYDNIEEIQTFNDEVKATVLFISDNLNSLVRGSVDDFYYSVDSQNKVVGAIPFTEVASSDSVIPTTNSTYLAGDASKFKGIVSALDTTNPYVEGDVVIYNNDTYYYKGSSWHKTTFIGIDEEFPTSASTYDVFGLKNKLIRSYYNGSTWVIGTYRGVYEDTSQVITPTNGDIINIKNTDDYYVYTTEWVKLNNRGLYNRVEDVVSPATNDFATFNGVTYYIYISSTWKDFTHYVYKEYDTEVVNE